MSYITWLDIECPECQTPAGEPCTVLPRYGIRGHHYVRDLAARKKMKEESASEEK